MVKAIRIDGVDYPLDNLSPEGKETFAAIQYTDTRLQELKGLMAVMGRAKNGYVEDIKREILSEKTGLFLGDD